MKTVLQWRFLIHLWTLAGLSFAMIAAQRKRASLRFTEDRAAAARAEMETERCAELDLAVLELRAECDRRNGQTNNRGVK